MSTRISPAYLRNVLRVLYEFFNDDERFQLDPAESQDDWAERIQNGLNFGVSTSPVTLLQLDFNCLAVAFAAQFDAMGAHPCIYWEGNHLIIPIKDGRLKHPLTEKIRPHFQDLVLLFSGRIQELQQMNAATHGLSVLCKDLRCGAPDHMVVDTRQVYLLRKKCTGPPCQHGGFPCFEAADRLPLALPNPRPAHIVARMTKARKVAAIKKAAKVVANGVRGMRNTAIEVIMADDTDEDDEADANNPENEVEEVQEN